MSIKSTRNNIIAKRHRWKKSWSKLKFTWLWQKVSTLIPIKQWLPNVAFQTEFTNLLSDSLVGEHNTCISHSRKYINTIELHKTAPKSKVATFFTTPSHKNPKTHLPSTVAITNCLLLQILEISSFRITKLNMLFAYIIKTIIKNPNYRLPQF